MGVPKRLTEMQKRFAEFIVFGGPDGPVSQGEAAKLAGYSEKRARNLYDFIMRIDGSVHSFARLGHTRITCSMDGCLQIVHEGGALNPCHSQVKLCHLN